LEIDLQTKRGIFDDRFWGVLYSVQQAVPRMKNGGSITFTSGTVVVRPLSGLGHLIGAAGSPTSTTYGLALDLAPKNARINTIAPGLIDTELLDVIETIFSFHC
jgi:NAD(P)-dependent dehydrogenase (short-subunit alcohol dehydrogenase family)